MKTKLSRPSKLSYKAEYYFLRVIIFIIVIVLNSSAVGKASKAPIAENKRCEPINVYDLHGLKQEDTEIAKIKQQIWQNLTKVPGTNRDYESIVHLRIADGNIIDADCKLLFPESSWTIASVLDDDYKTVLKNTNVKIFSVIYRLITTNDILATEINFSGLWRPWMGSHVHIEGRGIDISSIRSISGSGVIFNINTSRAENDFGKKVRDVLTQNFPVINQYLSPWFICSPTSSTCKENQGNSTLEKIHRDHLHLTLSE